MTSGSQPLSKRADASERRPSRRLRPADRRWEEPRHLQQHVGGGRRDLAVGAAHDAGDADRAVVEVADQEVVGGQRPLDVVEGRQRLAVGGPADPEAAAAHLREVVGMVRLAQLEHHVVRDVDQGVDRPHAQQGQALLHPLRRLADGDAAQHPHDEPSAQVRVGDLDGGRVARRRRRRRRRWARAAGSRRRGGRPRRGPGRRPTWRRVGWGSPPAPRARRARCRGRRRSACPATRSASRMRMPAWSSPSSSSRDEQSIPLDHSPRSLRRSIFMPFGHDRAERWPAARGRRRPC